MKTTLSFATDVWSCWRWVSARITRPEYDRTTIETRGGCSRWPGSNPHVHFIVQTRVRAGRRDMGTSKQTH